MFVFGMVWFLVCASGNHKSNYPLSPAISSTAPDKMVSNNKMQREIQQRKWGERKMKMEKGENPATRGLHDQFLFANIYLNLNLIFVMQKDMK